MPAPVDSIPRNSRWSGFAHLLGARLRELQREPEVIFWVFGFPVLLALGLGIAFRNKPADITSVAVVAGPRAQDVLTLLQRSSRSSSIHAEVVEEQQALQEFRLGKYDLVIVPDGQESFQYRYDPARSESVLSRAEVDDALQIGAGRKNPVPTSAVVSSEPGSRYIDFLIPGLLGMNLMNSGMWGIGFALVDMRQRKLLKRFVATPMRRSDFLLALTSSRLVLMVIEIGLLLGFGILVFHMRVLGSLFTILLLATIGAVAFGGLGLLTASRAQKLESVSGLMNIVIDADVDFLRRLLLFRTFPRCCTAVHKIVTAHRPQRRHAGHDLTRCVPWSSIWTLAGSGVVGRYFVRASLAMVPLDLNKPSNFMHFRVP